jgi:hypothetical protein
VVECPACRFGHLFSVDKWKFNGDEEYPTFTPTMAVKLENGYVCHSRVTKGMIHFLPESTHGMAGQCITLDYVSG